VGLWDLDFNDKARTIKCDLSVPHNGSKCPRADINQSPFEICDDMDNEAGDENAKQQIDQDYVLEKAGRLTNNELSVSPHFHAMYCRPMNFG
jgi:hypothetical protein